MIKNLYRLLRSKIGLTDYRDLVIYMKSGSQIVCRKVNIDAFKYKYNGNAITEISGFRQHWTISERVLVQSIDLSQIEAFQVK